MSRTIVHGKTQSKTAVAAAKASVTSASKVAALLVLHANSVSAAVSKTRAICYFTTVDTLESWITLASVNCHALPLSRTLVDACAIRESAAGPSPAWIAVTFVESYAAPMTRAMVERPTRELVTVLTSPLLITFAYVIIDTDASSRAIRRI